MAHTSGPWDIHSGARGLEIHPATDGHGESPIADILTNEADARLIAEAPAMLEALRMLLRSDVLGGNVLAAEMAAAAILARIDGN